MTKLAKILREGAPESAASIFQQEWRQRGETSASENLKAVL
jgi:hypothetical protein